MLKDPLAELLETGKLGPAGAALLYRAVAQTARARNFPPPDEHNNWDDAAVAAVAHDFLTAPRGERRLADLVVRATSESSFRALIEKAVLNHLRDIARETDRGALIRRLGDVLAKADAVSKVSDAPARWALNNGPTSPSTAPSTRLAAAAVAVADVPIPRWRSTRRRAPVASQEALARLCTEILAAAEGSLDVPTLAAAVSARLEAARVPLTLELDTWEQIVDPQPKGQPEEGVVESIYAVDLFTGLSDREKILLATWERPLRDLGDILGVRHSQAQVHRQRLAVRLREELIDDEGADEVIHQMRAMAVAWLSERTSGRGSTSIPQ